MDLISREAAIEAIKELLYEPDSVQYIWSSDALSAVKHAHSVPAVPLDKLCEFLEKCGADSYCGTCNQIMGECFTNGKGCGSEHFWKELLTKWMEEQDAAD